MSLIDNETVPVKDVIRSISQGETERVDILVAYFNLGRLSGDSRSFTRQASQDFNRLEI